MPVGEIAYKQRFSVDLSTTDKWTTLAPGKHTLQIVARAGNYIDSDKSNPTELTREAPPDYLCFTAEKSGSTVAMTVNGTPTKGQAFETSTDRTNWSVFTPGTTKITLANAGDKVYFRGDNTTVSESNATYYKFVMSGKIAASGNIMSLLDKTCQSTTISNNYCYYYMFYGCRSLITAPALPATTLASHCYTEMFRGCTSLTTAPALPATTLTNGCYISMFYGCTSLTTAPALPATKLAGNCYQSMFEGCTSLTTAPELPATTLAGRCYCGMFEGCTSLTTAPELPATTLVNFCYQNMFYGCTSLTTAPALPATTLTNGCYVSMFQGCTSLKVSETQTEEYATAWRIPSTSRITSEPYNWNASMLTNTGGTFTANPSINTTYYIAG